MRKIHLLVLLILIGSASYGQDLGLILKGSTSGVGADLAYRINPKWLVKVGAERFNYEFLTNLRSADLNVDINSTIITGSYSLLADYQIYKKLYISGGVLINNFNTKVKGNLQSDYKFGDLVVSKEKVGTIEWDVKPESTIAPYLGLGIGNNINSKKKVNLSVELGGIFQGAPKFQIQSNGIFESNSDANFNQAGSLEESFSKFQIYPVLKINLGIKLSQSKNVKEKSKNLPKTN
jgi:hypothetical protein